MDDDKNKITDKEEFDLNPDEDNSDDEDDIDLNEDDLDPDGDDLDPGVNDLDEEDVDDEDEPVIDYDTEAVIALLLGKWELVMKYRSDHTIDEMIYTPNGYVEYLPDSCFGWYDYATQEYTLYEGKYWIDHFKYPKDFPSDKNYVWNDWVLHYENPWIGEGGFGGGGYKYGYQKDIPGGNNFQITNISQDTIKLYCLDYTFGRRDFDYIYSRKK